MKLSNKTYDRLKWVVLKLPALGTFIFALSEIWGLPYGDKIVGSIAALATFLCTLLGISSKNYYADIKAQNDDLSDWRRTDD